MRSMALEVAIYSAEIAAAFSAAIGVAMAPSYLQKRTSATTGFSDDVNPTRRCDLICLAIGSFPGHCQRSAFKED